MVQGGSRPGLADEAALSGRAIRPRQHFERNRPLQPRVHCVVDRAHAAFADLAENAVVGNRPAGERIGYGGRDGGLVEERRLIVRGKERLYFGAQARIAGATCVQKSGTPAGIQLQRLVQNLAHSHPFLSIQRAGRRVGHVGRHYHNPFGLNYIFERHRSSLTGIATRRAGKAQRRLNSLNSHARAVTQ
jgi:hypothetical protein